MSDLMGKVLLKAKEGHHPFGPSSLDQRLTCLGSLRLEVDIPDSRSVFADEGSFAHDVLADALRANDDAAHYIGRHGGTAPDAKPFVWTAEDAAYGQQYLDLVRSLASDGRFDPSALFVENRFDLSFVIPGCYGTADAVYLDYPTDTIHVVDLKWGKGVKVTEENNPQLMAYGLAVYKAFELLHPWKRVVGHICQPRVGGAS